MSLFENFFEGRENLLKSFKDFDSKHNQGLINSLSKENSEIDFLSTITEIHFGIFFDEYSSSAKHEKPHDGQTPDWTFNINGQQIIAEVLRLNPSLSDKVKLDFDDNFMNAIHEIKTSCILSFYYDEKVIDRKAIDIKMCKALVEDWLNKKPAINDTIILLDSIEIQLINYPPNLDHVCLAGGGGGINYNYSRLHGANSALLKKGQKYSSIIEKYNLPYIVCIYMDFHTWFRKDDLYNSLYGLSAEHEGRINYFSHNIEKALFYSDRKLMTNVSGILLRQNDEFTYYHNNSKSNRLNIENQNLLLRWQHPHE